MQKIVHSCILNFFSSMLLPNLFNHDGYVKRERVFQMQENSTDDVPMPTYFRFLALLAFKIFAAEQV